MTRQVIYRYMGTNGIIESPIHLEDTYYIRLLRLVADEGKILYDGKKIYTPSILIPEEEEENWYEIKFQGQD